MASKPIEISFVADVASYLRSVKDVEVSTEDIGEALVAVSNDSKDLERKLDKAMKAAEKDTESLERAIDGLGDTTAKETRRMERDFDDVGGEIKENTREVGQEAGQNLAEGLSSGINDVEDVADTALGTIGGLVNGLSGPIGLAAGAVAGGAALVFNQVFQEWQQRREMIKESTDSLWGEMVAGAEGAVAAIDEAMIQSEIQKLWTEDPEGLAQARDAAEVLGLNLDTVLRARVGDRDAAAEVAAYQELVNERLREANIDIRDGTAREQERARVLKDEVGGAYSDINNFMEDGDAIWEGVNDRASDYNKWLRDARVKTEGLKDDSALINPVWDENIRGVREYSAALDEATRDRNVNVTVNETTNKRTAVYPNSGVTD